MAKAKLSTRLYNHVAADFNPDWAEKAAKLMDEAADIVAKVEDRKPVAYLGTEKVKQPGKDGPNTILAYPNSPRSVYYDWVPLFT